VEGTTGRATTIVKRVEKPLVEKLKVPAVIALWLVANEWADPMPAQTSLLARFLVLTFAFFVARSVYETLLVTSSTVAKWHEGAAEYLGRYKKRVPPEAWIRLQRLFTWFVFLYIYGSILSTLTDKCEGAVSCVIRTIPIAYENVPTFIAIAISVMFSMLNMVFFFYSMVRMGTYKVIQPGTIQTTFDDVWGQDKAREAIMEQVRILNDATAVEEAGGYLPKGVILYGPPGVGKTYLAKAAANASSKPLILYPPGATASTFMGIAELKIFMLFREIRKQARRHGGVIVFYDEIDVMGSRGGVIGETLDRLGMNFSAVKESYQRFINGSATSTPVYEGCVPYDPDEPAPIFISNQSSQALTTFLAAMDGMEEPRGFLNKMLKMLGFKPIPPPHYRYMMLGATNRLEVLDPALLRAGRFGRKVQVDYPRADGRQRTYEGYLGKIASHTLTEDNIAWIARHDHQGSGASIKDVVNEAVLLTFRDGRDTPGVVTFDDVTKAMSIIKFGEPGDMWERQEAVWGVSVHEAGHAVAFHYLNRHRQDIWTASILPRGSKGGFVAPTSKWDDWLLTREDLLADVQISLASRVAEKLILGQASNGHGGDGPAATKRAMHMVTLGHGGQIGSYDKDEVALGLATEAILEEALEKVGLLLTSKVPQVEAVARLIADKGEVRGTEIHELLDEMDGVLSA